MKISGCVVLVTGAGRGIGRAICREFARRGATGIVAADLDLAAAQATAAESGGLGLRCNVAVESEIMAVVEAARARFGRVDILVSNAGFGAAELDLDDVLSTPNATWQRMWDVHVMAHVYASRAVLPGMLERGSGGLLSIASAAGLLSQVGDAPYSATKHAAVGLAESLSITYGERGVQVSVVCPQYVATAIVGMAEESGAARPAGVLAVEEAAGIIADGLEAGRFLILTHPEVQQFFQRKAADHDRWIVGMRRLRTGLRSGGFLKVKR
jgi:NAD(P)-dependent dehydrogenase (short-subunit alcohol dehydrogenase family)